MTSSRISTGERDELLRTLQRLARRPLTNRPFELSLADLEKIAWDKPRYDSICLLRERGSGDIFPRPEITIELALAGGLVASVSTTSSSITKKGGRASIVLPRSNTGAPWKVVPDEHNAALVDRLTKFAADLVAPTERCLLAEAFFKLVSTLLGTTGQVARCWPSLWELRDASDVLKGKIDALGKSRGIIPEGWTPAHSKVGKAVTAYLSTCLLLDEVDQTDERFCPVSLPALKLDPVRFAWVMPPSTND